MRVRSAVLSSLALVALLASSGCPSTYGCDPPSERFDLDEPVTAAELDEIIAAGYSSQTSWASVECETVCQHTYDEVRGWEASNIESCTLVLPENPDGTGAAGRITCKGTGIEFYCEGRRPLEHAEAGDEGCADALGRSLAAMAYLEAASVLAFEELAAWLQARSAPAELVDRCRAAADDERHHARWLTKLAEERGATVPVPTARPVSEASVLEVALHNAVEGCVHESFAALMAAVRSVRADDLRLRRVFARIAADETRHGQLAWDLDAWLRERLEPALAREVEQRQREALARLPEHARALQRVLPEALGRLDGGQAERIASCFAARLVA
jgi:rubrerythrin